MDLYRGTIAAAGGAGSLTASNTWDLAAGSCLNGNFIGVAPIPTSPGYNDSVVLSAAQDPNPAVGTAVYYLVTKQNAPGASPNAHGCANPAVCAAGPNAGAGCSSDAQCGGALCMNVNIAIGTGLNLGAFDRVSPSGPFGCLGPGSAYRSTRQVTTTSMPPLCP